MKYLKRLAILVAGLALAYSLIIGVGGGFYWSSLSNTEKCVMLTKIQVLHESTFSAKYYEEEPIITQTCSIMNGGR